MMDIHIDISATEGTFGLFASSNYELTFAGLSVWMTAEQFQQLCDNLRPWVVQDGADAADTIEITDKGRAMLQVAAHTPGPWYWVASADDDGIDRNEPSGLPALVSVHGPVVCWFGDAERYYPSEGHPPHEADARLIAAAPELLAELRHLVRLMEPLERAGSLNIPGLATLNATRTVIAKGQP